MRKVTLLGYGGGDVVVVSQDFFLKQRHLLSSKFCTEVVKEEEEEDHQNAMWPLFLLRMKGAEERMLCVSVCDVVSVCLTFSQKNPSALNEKDGKLCNLAYRLKLSGYV